MNQCAQEIHPNDTGNTMKMHYTEGDAGGRRLESTSCEEMKRDVTILLTPVEVEAWHWTHKGLLQPWSESALGARTRHCGDAAEEPVHMDVTIPREPKYKGLKTSVGSREQTEDAQVF